jgi:uncharacterized membrane protein
VSICATVLRVRLRICLYLSRVGQQIQLAALATTANMADSQKRHFAGQTFSLSAPLKIAASRPASTNRQTPVPHASKRKSPRRNREQKKAAGFPGSQRPTQEAPVRVELTMSDLQSDALATWLRRRHGLLEKRAFSKPAS